MDTNNANIFTLDKKLSQVMRIIPGNNQMQKTTPCCRFCGKGLEYTFVDLGLLPLANEYVKPDREREIEKFYPLRCYVCDGCYLVQLDEIESPENIFTDYAYFSSYSASWLHHSKMYAEMIIDRIGLNSQSHVIEIASNDGYLLQYFMERGIPILGIEPAKNVAKVANDAGIPTIPVFFGLQTSKALSEKHGRADLLIGNNVLAHVPNLNDFVMGMKIILEPQGTITMEFPHLLRLIDENQFDTIYHEHFSYFSLYTVQKVFAAHGLNIYDVEEITTHGGSLRIYACHAEDESKCTTDNVMNLIDIERQAGLTKLEKYLAFNEKVKRMKYDILSYLIEIKRQGKIIAAYGAPAKGNTLLNYCGIGTDFIDYAVDLSPCKQGLLLPGTHIPIYHPDKVRELKPDYLLILPWNLKDEIIGTMSFIKEWDANFLMLLPEIEVI